jgi:hypothetical protein
VESPGCQFADSAACFKFAESTGCQFADSAACKFAESEVFDFAESEVFAILYHAPTFHMESIWNGYIPWIPHGFHMEYVSTYNLI